MQIKIICTSFKATGDAVYMKFNVFEGVHRHLLNFICNLEKWSDSDINKLDIDYENTEEYEDYEFLEGGKYDIHVIAYGGKKGVIHLIVSLRDPELKKQLMERIKKYFVMKCTLDVEEGWL